VRLGRTLRSVLVGGGLVAGAAILVAQGALSRVGMAESDGREAFDQAMIGMASPGLAAKPFLALSPASRATVVTELVGWARTYANSATFKKDWTQKRDQNKPEALTAAASPEEQKKKQDAEQQKQLEDLKKTIASLPADQQKQMQAMVDQMMAAQAAAAKDPQYQALMKQANANEAARTQKDYQDAVAKWQHDYPVDPNVVIARRLKDFLAMSADVNFDAKLVAKDGRKEFADPAFQSKPDAWKMCFRAGREATMAARAAAQQWLKELGQ
jgi:flagellar biosynthesis GTPase FlhF